MIRQAMGRSQEPLHSALATLRSRWGSAAIRLGDGGSAAGAVPAAETGLPVQGALALAALPEPLPGEEQAGGLHEGVVSTGFPALDAILGVPGLAVGVSAAFRGGPSSGKTTLALRCLAEAQAHGAIAAWLDLAHAFDPVEAMARGVDLRWLLVVRPVGPEEGFSLAGALLAGRSIDLLAVDLPSRLRARAGDPLRRLAAHARRAGARLIVLEPLATEASVHDALARVTGLRLELERRAWLRLGRDVVGQRTEVIVARSHHGPPGRSATLDIHYLADGERSVAAHRLAVPSRRASPPASFAPRHRDVPYLVVS